MLVLSSLDNFLLDAYIIFQKSVDNFEIECKLAYFLVRGAVPPKAMTKSLWSLWIFFLSFFFFFFVFVLFCFFQFFFLEANFTLKYNKYLQQIWLFFCKNIQTFKLIPKTSHQKNNWPDVTHRAKICLIHTFYTGVSRGVRRERAHPVGLRQKQSNQPVFWPLISI